MMTPEEMAEFHWNMSAEITGFGRSWKHCHKTAKKAAIHVMEALVAETERRKNSEKKEMEREP